jgi:uncharacterized protein (DUF4415 family)
MRKLPEILSKLVPPSKEEDAAIRKAALADPDAQPMSPEVLASLKPRKPGRPKAPFKKVAISVRFDDSVVAFFKASGDGWQTRMNDVLKEYTETHEHA